jgi:uncharacterized protein YjbJ (UPF0337 family)
VNTDKVEGTIEEVLGRAKQKTGEMTGDTRLQFEGVAQHVKGEVVNAWGEAKDAAREANEEGAGPMEPDV